MKRFFAATTAALMVSLVASVAIAAPTPTTDVMGQSWRAYNRVFTPSLWDINKVKLTNGDLVIPIQQFDTPTTGSFAVYLLNNYNVDITGTTLTAVLSWSAGTYVTRGAAAGAYVRFEFQDVTAGPYDSNDYWWSTGTNSLDLNLAPWSGTLTASLTNCTLWSNQSGKSACNTTEDWQQWQGDIVHQSPAAGFAEAMKNVKQLGLSFGNVSSYASGIALFGATGTFTVSSFDVTP